MMFICNCETFNFVYINVVSNVMNIYVSLVGCNIFNKFFVCNFIYWILYGRVKFKFLVRYNFSLFIFKICNYAIILNWSYIFLILIWMNMNEY